MKNVYITRVSKFLPNEPVENDAMEERLGLINGKTSKARRIILRNNQIKTRYYALDVNGNVTHNNAQITAQAVEALCDETFNKNDIELLSCGTSSPDQILPSHASMVHGFLKNGNLEVNSPSGACCSGMNAWSNAYLALKPGQGIIEVSTGLKGIPPWMK